MYNVKSKVKGYCANHDEYYKVKHTVTDTESNSVRVLDDCQHFSNFDEAQAAIPELDRDLLESLEKGVL